MDRRTSPPQERELDIGERISIRPGSMPLPALVGRMGTVVEIYRVPLGSCRVRVDGDPEQQREWFFYRNEVVTSDGAGASR